MIRIYKMCAMFSESEISNDSSYYIELLYNFLEVTNMNQRYLKVLGLYIFSSAIGAMVTRMCDKDLFLKWFTQTTIGYGVFAYGLKVLTRAKNKEK